MLRFVLRPSVGVLTTVVAWSIQATAVSADTVTEFYNNKRLDFITGDAPGGSYDAWARLIAGHIGDHIPGRPSFVVKNMPGAGHIIAANYLFNVAPKTGATMGMFSRSIPDQAVLKNPSVQFDPARFNWIGSPETSNRICGTLGTGKVQKAADLFEHQLMVGGTGSNSGPTGIPTLLSGLLGMKFKLTVGYRSATEVMLAMERREVEGMCMTLEGIERGRPDWIASGKFKVLFNLETRPIPGIDAPTVFEFTKTEEQRQIISFYSSATEIGRPVVMPPSVPDERVQAVRRAFDMTMKDEAFIGEAKKQNLSLTPIKGEDLQNLVANLAKTPLSIVEETDRILAEGASRK